MYHCPICLKQYDTSTFDECTCGYVDFHEYEDENETLFKIFKYSKNVFYKRIKYTPAILETIYEEDNIKYVDIISKPRGLEIIQGSYAAINGVLAFSNTKALILDCDYAHKEFLDESSVKILFIGKDFKGFIGNPRLNQIKYLYVHKDNLYYKAENNKLIEKGLSF